MGLRSDAENRPNTRRPSGEDGRLAVDQRSSNFDRRRRTLIHRLQTEPQILSKWPLHDLVATLRRWSPDGPAESSLRLPSFSPLVWPSLPLRAGVRADFLEPHVVVRLGMAFLRIAIGFTSGRR